LESVARLTFGAAYRIVDFAADGETTTEEKFDTYQKFHLTPKAT
jgi:hypothetical protein